MSWKALAEDLDRVDLAQARAVVAVVQLPDLGEELSLPVLRVAHAEVGQPLRSCSRFSFAASMKSPVSFDMSSSVSVPTAPKSTRPIAPACVGRRMFAGCGSPWKKPCRKIIVIHASVIR
jgi:hypothetical protein